MDTCFQIIIPVHSLESNRIESCERNAHLKKTNFLADTEYESFSSSFNYKVIIKRNIIASQELAKRGLVAQRRRQFSVRDQPIPGHARLQFSKSIIIWKCTQTQTRQKMKSSNEHYSNLIFAVGALVRKKIFCLLENGFNICALLCCAIVSF
jgi:hypothetical protein